jgi:putative ABC transport system substrate-binding protein
VIRAIFVFICLLPTVLPPAGSQAQQPKKIARIGYLSARSAVADSTRLDEFRQALRKLGYTDEDSIYVHYRFAEGHLNRLPELAAALVHLNLDAIVADGATATRVLQQATHTTPIIMTNSSDPVSLGLVRTLAKPGGNITGLTNLNPDLGGKRLELLKELVPKLSRVAVIADPSTKAYGPQIKQVEVAATALNLQLQSMAVHGSNDLESAFLSIKTMPVEAIICLPQPTLTNLRERITELAALSRLPAAYGTREWVEAGGLMSYAATFDERYRRVAVYIDKILKGAKPADLPVEQPTKFELVINLKTAKQIGLTIPPHVLARADRIIR